MGQTRELGVSTDAVHVDRLGSGRAGLVPGCWAASVAAEQSPIPGRIIATAGAGTSDTLRWEASDVSIRLPTDSRCQ